MEVSRWGALSSLPHHAFLSLDLTIQQVVKSYVRTLISPFLKASLFLISFLSLLFPSLLFSSLSYVFFLLLGAID